MRSIVTFSAAVLIALPLAAADQKPASQQSPAAQPASAQAAPATDTSAQASSPADSPLVAAAKHTKRTGKSKIVITNDTLAGAGSKAHVTTTTSQREVKMPPKEPDTDWTTMENKRVSDAAAAKANAEAAAKKKAADDEAKKKRMAAMAAAYEEGYSEADPAALEHELATQNQPQPQTTTQGQPAKPPQEP